MPSARSSRTCRRRLGRARGAVVHTASLWRPSIWGRCGVCGFACLPPFRDAKPLREEEGRPVGDSESRHGIGDSLSMGLSQQSLTAGPCSCIMAGVGRALMLAHTMWSPHWSGGLAFAESLASRLITYVLRGQAIDEVGRNIFAGWDSQCIGMGTPRECVAFFRL